MIDRLPDWAFPVAYFGAAILIVLALWAVGDGRGPHAYAEEVQAARYLFSQERTAGPEEQASIDSALRSLDPDAIEEAERARR